MNPEKSKRRRSLIRFGYRCRQMFTSKPQQQQRTEEHLRFVELHLSHLIEKLLTNWSREMSRKDILIMRKDSREKMKNVSDHSFSIDSNGCWAVFFSQYWAKEKEKEDEEKMTKQSELFVEFRRIRLCQSAMIDETKSIKREKQRKISTSMMIRM